MLECFVQEPSAETVERSRTCATTAACLKVNEDTVQPIIQRWDADMHKMGYGWVCPMAPLHISLLRCTKLVESQAREDWHAPLRAAAMKGAYDEPAYFRLR